MDQTDLTQDRNRWQALMKAVIKLWALYNAGNVVTN